MNILVAYGTSEGQTRKIAGAVAAQARGLGHQVHLYDTAESPAGIHLETCDRVILAASVHQEQHQESVSLFVRARLATLQAKPSLFLSVSLSAAFPEGLADARSYLESFLAGTGWKPSATLLVAGALRYDEYDYFKEQIIQHVVLKGRRTVDEGHDHDFTDWAALAAAVDAFLRP
jgi:menaquinone-dependent protoporphyrinogen oxidase